MPASRVICDLLRGSQVSRGAADTLLGAGDRAKVIVCIADGAAVPAVLPTSLTVNTERLMTLAGAMELRFAEDEEARTFSADRIYVDVRLALAQKIVFATDTAEETVTVRWSDFARHIRPIVGDFAEPARDRVGAYRLSYRE